jgi:phosphoribosylformylglycinamidine synthase
MAGPWARYNTKFMKARVYVSLKSTVLDPQGQTIRSALNGLGYHSISDVRQGKYFEIAVDAGASRDQVHKDIDAIARDVLTNPVIEEYRVEFLD